MYGELSRCMVVVAGELRRQRRGEESMGMVMIFLRMRGPGAHGGFLAFELDIALFAAARDPATARRRMDSLRWLLLRRVRVRRTRIPLPARALLSKIQEMLLKK